MRSKSAPAVLLAVTLAGCAQPPQAAPGQVLGYGTPGVESYLPAGEPADLQALLERCRAAGLGGANPPAQTFGAACDQLRRTVRNQPGNTLAVSRP